MICFNSEQLAKIKSPISVTDEGNTTCFNDLHPEKALFPIIVIEGGITICSMRV